MGDRVGHVRPTTGRQRSLTAMELVRMAFPRRGLHQSHVDYLAEVILYVNSMKDSLVAA
ncbi:MAG: hypothetical protein R3C44_11785 [Chloroflexota bacterium]